MVSRSFAGYFSTMEPFGGYVWPRVPKSWALNCHERSTETLALRSLPHDNEEARTVIGVNKAEKNSLSFTEKLKTEEKYKIMNRQKLLRAKEISKRRKICLAPFFALYKVTTETGQKLDRVTGGPHALCVPSCSNHGYGCAVHPVRGCWGPILSQSKVW